MNTKRWLEELPPGSHERELLLVGKAARPAEGALEANWQAICATLGTTAAAASGTFASGSVNSAVAPATVKASASMAAGKAAATSLLVVAAKSLVVGAGVGFAVMGAAGVAEHVSSRGAPPVMVTKPPRGTSALREPPRPLPAASATPLDSPSSVPATAASSAASPSRSREPGGTPSAAAAPQLGPATPAMTPEEKTASLARQARELAELKRLIDSGATSEALRRLDKNFNAGTASALSEERDALYVQALARAQRRDEARAFARQFLVRYPHSPYFETVRQLLIEE